jgi:hypothetical protein
MKTAQFLTYSSLVLVFTFAFCTQSSAQLLGGGESGSNVKVDSEVKQTAWPSIPLPKITMPKISMPDMSVITTPVKAGYGKVTEGTKKAWEGTKEIFTFGKDDSAPTARSQPKEGFWKRMFTSEPDKNDGPQTVGEWMAQPRLDP